MKWVKRLIIVITSLLVLAIALPFMVPLNFLAPRVEKLLSDKIQEPVSIQSLRLTLLPVLGVTAGDISIGKLGDVHAESVRLAIAPLSLFKSIKVVNTLTINSLKLDQNALGRLPGWFKADAGPKQAVIKRVVLDNTNLDLKSVIFESLYAEIDLGDEGAFRHAQIEAKGKSLRLGVTPSGKDFLLDFQARNWKLPVGPALQFDSLNVTALTNGESLSIQELRGNLYGGNILGKAQLDWREHWRLQGKLHSSGVEVRQLVSVLSPETSVSGKLAADAQFNMRAKQAGQLFDNPAAEVEFKIKNGVLHNFDLMGAVKSMSKEGTRGGQTSFDEFSGNLHLLGKAHKFRELKIGSGLLRADGNLDIAPSKELAGRMYVEVKGTASLISMPLQISGDLSNPVLRPTNAAIAGAVAGTAVLGPLGTSLGAKAGDYMERLFK